MQDKDKGGAGQLKKIVTGLDSNRKNIQSKSDVANNLSQAKESFSQLQGIIRGQTGTINSLKAFEKSMANENSRNLELKKFFTTFAEKLKNQISKLLKLGQNVFTTSALKSNKEDDYEKVASELMKTVNSIKEESDTSEKMYAGVYRLVGIKDNIFCQFLRVMLYKKNVLWRDLNMRFDDYIHGEVKSSLNKIKENQEKYGYIPSSLHFRMPKAQTESESSLYDLLSIVFQDQAELLDSMKNFSKLSEEPQLIQDISKNQHIVKGLRQKIQVLTKNYNNLLEKYRSLQISKGKVQLSPTEEKSLSDKIEQLQAEIQKKSQDFTELKQVYMKSENAIQGLKDKNKELEDQISKWQNFQMPKIKELEMAQKTLLDEFTKTKKDFETYSGLYETERQDKIKAYTDLKDEKNRLSQMANILGRQRRKIKELKAQLVRKDQIIMELVEKAPDP